MMWDFNDAWGHGSALGAWFMFIVMVAIVVGVVFLVVYLVRQMSQPASGGAQSGPLQFRNHAQAGVAPPTPSGTVAPAQGPAPETPRDILRRRYAAGEIERDEYLQKLADLDG